MRRNNFTSCLLFVIFYSPAVTIISVGGKSIIRANQEKPEVSKATNLELELS